MRGCLNILYYDLTVLCLHHFFFTYLFYQMVITGGLLGALIIVASAFIAFEAKRYSCLRWNCRMVDATAVSIVIYNLSFFKRFCQTRSELFRCNKKVTTPNVISSESNKIVFGIKVAILSLYFSSLLFY